jgi:hypothetical protein
MRLQRRRNARGISARDTDPARYVAQLHQPRQTASTRSAAAHPTQRCGPARARYRSSRAPMRTGGARTCGRCCAPAWPASVSAARSRPAPGAMGLDRNRRGVGPLRVAAEARGDGRQLGSFLPLGQAPDESTAAVPDVGPAGYYVWNAVSLSPRPASASLAGGLPAMQVAPLRREHALDICTWRYSRPTTATT